MTNPHLDGVSKQLIDVLRQAGVECVYGVVSDSLNLHRFVRRQFAIYSVRGHASAGSNPTPTRGH